MLMHYKDMKGNGVVGVTRGHQQHNHLKECIWLPI